MGPFARATQLLRAKKYAVNEKSFFATSESVGEY
jgi:hypothetical protein